MPTIAPVDFAGLVSPQHGVSHEFTVAGFPSSGKLSTSLALDDAAAVAVRVKRIVVYEVVPVPFTPPDPLPDGEEPQPQMGFDLFVLREGDGTTPLDVDVGNLVKIEVAASNLTVDQARATLIVSGDAWDPVSASLSYQPDTDVLTTFGTVDLAANQGGIAVTSIAVESIAGPAVDLTFELIADASADRIRMDAIALHLAPGEARTATLVFRVREDCLVGRKTLRVQRSGGSNVDSERVVALQVLPAAVILHEPLRTEFGDRTTAVITADDRRRYASSPALD